MPDDSSGQSIKSLVNGQDSSVISIFDRSVLYGDGCFETILIHQHKPVLAELHYQRLVESCKLFNIPLDCRVLDSEVEQLLSLNAASGILKIIVSRGSGGRGYGAAEISETSRILQFHETPPETNLQKEGANVVLCQHRLANSSVLAGHKNLNRLDQVLASAEIVDGFSEGLCLDQNGLLVEGCKSNLLMARGGELYTPGLQTAGVRGVMLQYLQAKFEQQGITILPVHWALEELLQCDEVFLCNSIMGVWPVIKLVENARVCTFPIGSFTQQAIRYHHELLAVSP
jgi:4-amino-4-deoxychorismate lyase